MSDDVNEYLMAIRETKKEGLTIQLLSVLDYEKKQISYIKHQTKEFQARLREGKLTKEEISDLISTKRITKQTNYTWIGNSEKIILITKYSGKKDLEISILQIGKNEEKKGTSENYTKIESEYLHGIITDRTLYEILETTRKIFR